MNRETQKKLLKLVKNNYSEIAEQFNETRKKQIWQEIDILAKKVKPGSSVLDVGCGNGRLLEALPPDIDYLGVDNSEKLLELARKEHPQNKFIEGDILDLGKAIHRKYDYIFCVAVLHHLPGKDLRIKALKELKEVVWEDGEIIISVWNLWQQNKFRNLILKNTFKKIQGRLDLDFGDVVFDWKNNKGEIISKRYYHAFSKIELIKLAIDAGLELKDIYKDKYNYYLILAKTKKKMQRKTMPMAIEQAIS